MEYMDTLRPEKTWDTFYWYWYVYDPRIVDMAWLLTNIWKSMKLWFFFFYDFYSWHMI